MNRYPYRRRDDLVRMQALLLATRPTEHLNDFPATSDLAELLEQTDVRSNTALWWKGEQLVAYALVDTRYRNLYFETLPEADVTLMADLIGWGERSVLQSEPEASTLDTACLGEYQTRVELLKSFGFTEQDVKTLTFSTRLNRALEPSQIPGGYHIRSLNVDEVEAAVGLHRAAFGTNFFTVEERRAMMNQANYEAELDLLAVAPDGSLAASVFGSVEDRIGFTDPVCVHPQHQGKGLARALLLYAFAKFKERGVTKAALTTSSENVRAIRVFKSVGFELEKSKLWFEKSIGEQTVIEVA